jgi:hypothetical protein
MVQHPHAGPFLSFCRRRCFHWRNTSLVEVLADQEAARDQITAFSRGMGFRVAERVAFVFPIAGRCPDNITGFNPFVCK